jgi:hypothetical protein
MTPIQIQLRRMQRRGTLERVLTAVVVVILAAITETLCVELMAESLNPWAAVPIMVLLAWAAASTLPPLNRRRGYVDVSLYPRESKLRPRGIYGNTAPCERVNGVLLWQHWPYDYASLYVDSYKAATPEGGRQLLAVCEEGTLALLRLDEAELGLNDITPGARQRLDWLWENAKKVVADAQQERQARLAAVRAAAQFERRPAELQQAAEVQHRRDVVQADLEAAGQVGGEAAAAQDLADRLAGATAGHVAHAQYLRAE